MTPELLLAAVVAVAAGLMGCFAVMRRMTLAGDALSHVALPGIGLALALEINPLYGAAAMLAFGALIIWALEDQTRLATETVIGVVFSTALAIGSMMLASGDELVEALFGQTGRVGWMEVGVGLAGAVAVVVFVMREKNRLVLMLVSPDIARTARIDHRRLNFLYLQAFALTVALGLRFLGVLLMGSLVIIPAAAAKRLSRNLTEMLIVAAAIAAATTIGGSLLAGYLHRETGPVIVTLAALAFLLTLIRRR
jgi:ABC-type Mn2+/Zn2+ transport system permease subunit